jgi:peptide/nickel transport system ATP-binding protein
VVFQEQASAFNPVLTVGEQIAESLVLHEVASHREARREATTGLERMGLPDAARQVRASRTSSPEACASAP